MSVAAQTSGWNTARYRDDSSPEKIVLTPEWLLERLCADVFYGDIDLDPATTPDNPCGAKRFVCLPEDGRLVAWAGNVFVNPPWGDRGLLDWIKKAHASAMNPATKIVMLLPTRTDTKWFRKAVECSDVLLMFHRRLDFTRGTERRVRGAFGALFASGLVGWNVDFNDIRDVGMQMQQTHVEYDEPDCAVCKRRLTLCKCEFRKGDDI